jgi:VIT1/CCC1 family predicted Fe2+/Mn2+ transporter
LREDGGGGGRAAPHPIFGDALSPIDRITEVFCGLVMVLTVTLLAGRDVATGPEGVRSLLRAALGGNFAWGIIDGVVYLMTQRYERHRRARRVAIVRDARDDAAVRGALGEVIDRELVAPMTPDEASRVFSMLHVLAGRLEPVSPHITRRDLVGALACFCLCVGCALPAAVPFLIFDAPLVALRVSNAVSLASLFLLGTIWAKQIGARRLLTGLGLLLVGAALVGLQLALGR